MSPKRVVVKEYGRDSILFAAVNPVMTTIMAGLGLRAPLASEERIARAMEKDAVTMAKRRPPVRARIGPIRLPKPTSGECRSTPGDATSDRSDLRSP